jgi:hypothetical protein
VTTPLADSELGFASEPGEFLRGVPVLHGLPLHQEAERSLDALQAAEEFFELLL